MSQRPVYTHLEEIDPLPPLLRAAQDGGSPGRDKTVVDKAGECGYILPITDVKNGISTIIRSYGSIGEAEKEEVLITRHGKPTAAVIGFHDDDDGFVPISISL